MSSMISWPECFVNNTLDFSHEKIEDVLAVQLCAWGNVYMGVAIPSNFFEVMDAASKVTDAFTPEACRLRTDIILAQRRNRNRDNFNPDEE